MVSESTRNIRAFTTVRVQRLLKWSHPTPDSQQMDSRRPAGPHTREDPRKVPHAGSRRFFSYADSPTTVAETNWAFSSLFHLRSKDRQDQWRKTTGVPLKALFHLLLITHWHLIHFPSLSALCEFYWNPANRWIWNSIVFLHHAINTWVFTPPLGPEPHWHLYCLVSATRWRSSSGWSSSTHCSQGYLGKDPQGLFIC